MEMDIRTVKKYTKSTVVRVGGNRKDHNLLHSSLKVNTTKNILDHQDLATKHVLITK